MTELTLLISSLSLGLTILVVWLLIHHKRQASHIIDRLETHHEAAEEHAAILKEQTGITLRLSHDIQNLVTRSKTRRESTFVELLDDDND